MKKYMKKKRLQLNRFSRSESLQQIEFEGSDDKSFAEVIKEIDGDIDVMVYTYDDFEDFDENGSYRGNSKYEINIDLV